MASAYTTSLIKTFVDQYGRGIIYGIQGTGLFFPSTVAQLSIESANGTSSLTVNYFNFGGIKGNESNGVWLPTHEMVNGILVPTYDWFRKFNSLEEFMSYYVSNFQRPLYADIFSASSPEEQIKRMVADGYSTLSPAQYLANGVQDRINATRDLYQLAKIDTDEQKFAAGVMTNTITPEEMPIAPDAAIVDFFGSAINGN